MPDAMQVKQPKEKSAMTLKRFFLSNDSARHDSVSLG